jgi:uncharacterized protein involved in response to NO
MGRGVLCTRDFSARGAGARADRCAIGAWFWIVGAGSCWILAFAIYVAAHARRLIRPRADASPADDGF